MRAAAPFASVLAALAVSAQAAPTAPSAQRAEPAACSAPALGFGAGEGRNDERMPPTGGELRAAMLFVDFSDSPGVVAPQAIHDAYVPRLVEWYRTVSYGRLRITVEPYTHWIRAPRSLEEYQQGRFAGAIQAVVEAADPSFDFSSFDALYVVASMPSLASTVIEHDPIRVDGTAIHVWAWLATGSLERLPAVLTHETGHVLGLPDLYRERLPSSKHVWDVMTAAGSGGMFAWHRWKLGWLDGGQVTCLRHRGAIGATLTPLERPGGKKALISRTGNAAIVVEVRRAIAEDASLCRGGVLFYRVDFSSGAPANAGHPGLPIELRPARPDDGRRRSRCGVQWRAPFGVGPGRVSRATAWRHELRVLQILPDGSYRVRLTRT